VVLPMRTRNDGKDIEVPNGLVHHWQAIGFIPGVTLDQVLQLAEDYGRHAQVYGPDYNVKFTVDYCVPEGNRAYFSSHSVRIAEVQKPGNRTRRTYRLGMTMGICGG